jgi:dihydrofolate reductase
MKRSKYISVSAIAAIGNQRQIGKGNELLWHIPEDLQHFKKLTSGKAVIMGRKTWESLPESARPLPGRENIVLTNDEKYEALGGVVKNNLDEAILYAKNWSDKNSQEEVFIIGGATIYQQALLETKKLYLTLVNSDKSGDAFFPTYKNRFTEVNRETRDENTIDYAFVTLEKK